MAAHAAHGMDPRELTTFTSAADVLAASADRTLVPVQVRIDLDAEPPRWVVIEP